MIMAQSAWNRVKGVCMSYEEFVSGMELELKSLVSDNLLVSVQKTLKNNGYLRCGIRLSEKNINISPLLPYFIRSTRTSQIRIGRRCRHYHYCRQAVESGRSVEAAEIKRTTDSGFVISTILE